MISISTVSPWVYIPLLVVSLAVLVYRASIPKRIPGNIPYHEASAKRPFGDIPDVLGVKNPLDFFLARANEIKSPIFQIFLHPFGRPNVIVCDSREAHDILTRRTREFDRAKFFADMFVSVSPNNQVVLPTNDQWHSNRRLMADTMSPAFLNKSAAPQAAAVFATFIELWRRRAELANGMPFDAELDIDWTLLDTISGIAFGSPNHAVEAERDYANSSANITKATKLEGVDIVQFDRTPPPAEHTAFVDLAHSVQIPADSIFGVWAHKFALRFHRSLRVALKIRHQIFTRQIHIASERFSNPEASGDDIKSAIDLIVQREIVMAKKQNRKPDLYSPTMDDEVFGFLIAGYDTTATTVKWGVKFLSRYPAVQTKLRNELHAAFATSLAQGGRPSMEDILQNRPVYLDAVIEEILRLGNPGVAPLRTATCDTTILGHFIPKGTDVLLMNHGPGQTQPPYYVDESTRSKSSQESIETAYTGNWDPNTLGDFLPERWLFKSGATGQQEFNPRAGSQQTFGGGLRGCFGRKLAYVMMRLLFTMIVWEFELLPVAEPLDTFSSSVILTHTPNKCYVKLKTVNSA